VAGRRGPGAAGGQAELDAASLRASVERFRDLTTLTGEVSVTLNRLAVTHASAEKARLAPSCSKQAAGDGRQLKPVLEADVMRLLRFADSEGAFRTFFGLVVRDVQIRLLLGDELKVSAAQIESDAKTAAEQFFALYGAR
jgi:hypothetical protein